MAISLRAAGTVSGSTRTPAPAYPAGITANDISVLTVVAKPNVGVLPQDVTCATPAGWRLLFSGSSGNSPPDSNAWSGSVNIWIFTRTGGTFTGTVPLSLTNHAVAAGVISTYAGSLGTGWNTATVYGYHNDSANTAYDSNKTVASTNLLVTTGDWMLIQYGGPWVTALATPAITATGATLGTVNSRGMAGSSANGQDSRIEIRDVTVSSGTSTVGPRMTSTTIQDGIAVFIRLREGVSSVSGSDAFKTTVDKSSLGAQITMPTADYWTNGEDLNAANLNARFRDPISWLMTDSPGIQVECTVPVTFTSTSHTITWDKIRYRRGSIVLNGTKVGVPTTGHYIGQFSTGVRKIGTMGFPFVATVDILTYPGGTGTANVHNISGNYTTMAVEESFSIGSQPFSLYLNQGDAIEVRLSGGWNTAGGAGLWVSTDAGATNAAVVTMLDLHWFSTWDGVSR